MIREVLIWPNSKLRVEAEEVTEFDESLAELVNDMAETMYHYQGVGLAATQIDDKRSVIVMDCAEPDSPSEFQVFVNPLIYSSSEEKIVDKEGCLSFPRVQLPVSRKFSVKGTAQTVEGESFEFSFDGGLESLCIQHECEHLIGMVLVDHCSRPQRRLIESKLKKLKKKHRISNE